jgi:hypothetical protein
MTATLRATGRVEPDEILTVLLASHGDPAVVTANLAGPLAVVRTELLRAVEAENRESSLARERIRALVAGG